MDFRSLLPFARGGLPATGGEGDPFLAMQREISRMFDDVWSGKSLPAAFAGPGLMTPRIDVKETEAGLEISAELPGVDEKDIDLQLADDRLLIKGEKKLEKENKQKDYYVMERSYGSFQRVIPLPFAPAADAVKASFAKGVLTVSVARPPEAAAKVKKIDVQPG